jgi:uncharacterized membrane protein
VTSVEALLMLARMLHLLFVISWIGRLYWVNFAESPFLHETNTRSRGSDVIWWWKWSPLGTVLTGGVCLAIKWHRAGWVWFVRAPYGVFILTGAAMGLIMAANVWLVIRPRKRLLKNPPVGNLASALSERRVVENLRRIGLVTRTNTLLSIPVLFFMSAAGHYMTWPQDEMNAARLVLWVVPCALVVIAVELNALIGEHGLGKKVLESPPAVVFGAMALCAMLFGITSLALSGRL